jgi:hypothetical protein
MKGGDKDMLKETFLKYLKKQFPSELKHDEQLADLGYQCKGKLCELPLYKRKGIFERLWLWEKESKPPVITIDLGNGWCDVVALKDIDHWNDETWFKRVLPKD